MARGIVDTIKLMVTVGLAIPIALMGLDFLLFEGEPLFGGVFVALAVAMVAIEEYLVSPRDIPLDAAQKAAGTVVKTPEDEEE